MWNHTDSKKLPPCRGGQYPCQQVSDEESSCSVELFLGMSLDRAVGGWIGHAGQHESGFDLIVVKEALVRLINSSSGDLASASGAGARAAGIRQVNALLFSGIEDVLIVRDLDGLVETLAFGDQGDLIRSHEWSEFAEARNKRACRTNHFYNV